MMRTKQKSSKKTLAQREAEADSALRKLTEDLKDVVAGEEQRVREAIGPEVDEHERILKRSKALGSRRIYR